MSHPAVCFFTYTGSTGLTVIGPLTGKRYRFPMPGTRIAVDGADAPSLALVPGVRQVPGPADAAPPRER